jgi:hypothetical protein
VHGTAFAFAVAGFLSVDFGHHPPHVRALGDAVAVPAVMADNTVFNAQVTADSGCDGLLADVGVDETFDVARLEFLVRPLLEPTDRKHSSIQINQGLFGESQ